MNRISALSCPLTPSLTPASVSTHPDLPPAPTSTPTPIHSPSLPGSADNEPLPRRLLLILYHGPCLLGQGERAPGLEDLVLRPPGVAPEVTPEINCN